MFTIQPVYARGAHISSNQPAGGRMSARCKVFLTNPVHADAQTLLAAHTDLVVGNEAMSRPQLLQTMADVDILFNKLDHMAVDAELMDAAPKLRLVARHGSGYSNVDVPHATSKGIAVTTTPGANAVTMAEYTLGLMFAAARNLVAAADACKRGNVDRLHYMGMELHGKTFGIIGVGAIGREVVSRVTALGMRVLAYHPRPSASALRSLPLTLVDLDTLLAESDVVSIHSPLTDATRALIHKGTLALMKPTACLLNLSRGGVVVEADMLAALRAEKLACYATDVLENEPVQADNPLLAEPRAIVLPHIAAVTREAQRAVAMTAVQDILRVVRGERPLHVVNPAVFG